MVSILVDRFGKPVAFREGVAAARKITVQVRRSNRPVVVPRSTDCSRAALACRSVATCAAYIVENNQRAKKAVPTIRVEF